MTDEVLRERRRLWSEWSRLRASRGRDPSLSLFDAESVLSVMDRVPEVVIRDEGLPRDMTLGEAKRLYARNLGQMHEIMLAAYRGTLEAERQHTGRV